MWACNVHYNGVIMRAMSSQITSLTMVYSTVYSGADQRKYQRSASLAFVRGIHRWPMDSLRKWPVTRKMFPFDDVIMYYPSPTVFMPWTVPILKKWGFTLSFFDKGLRKYFIDMIEQIINSRKAGDTVSIFVLWDGGGGGGSGGGWVITDELVCTNNNFIT